MGSDFYRRARSRTKTFKSRSVQYKRHHLVCNVEIYKKGQNAYEINGGSSYKTLTLVGNDCHNGVEARLAIMLCTVRKQLECMCFILLLSRLLTVNVCVKSQ